MCHTCLEDRFRSEPLAYIGFPDRDVRCGKCSRNDECVVLVGVNFEGLTGYSRRRAITGEYGLEVERVLEVVVHRGGRNLFG